MRWQHFLIASMAIFLLERLLPFFVWRPVSIFPLFAIGFLVQSRDLTRDLSWLVAASLIFDFFSGFEFGVLTLIILALTLAAYLMRKVVSIESASFISWIRSTFILFLAYLVLVSTFLPVEFLLVSLPLLIGQSLLILALLFFVFRPSREIHDSQQVQNQKA